MKLIHCADLHLDARMESGLSKEKAAKRRLELLWTFTRMVEQAEEEQVEAILLCGDLFDARTISVRAKNCVLDAMVQHPKIYFYYLQGNHDQNSFLEELSELPDNLRVFGPDWTTYVQGDVTIVGAELCDQTPDDLLERLTLERGRTNIVMLHAMVTEYGAQNSKEEISLRALRGKHISYLALGHIHHYQLERLDEEGMWCYCGCLEGRGFDECGEKGYVELTVQDGTLTSTFVPFAERSFHEVSVDITGLMTQEEIQREIQKALEDIPKRDMVKVVLIGAVSPEAEKDTIWVQRWLENDYYYLRVKDKTTLKIEPEDYQYDVSFKGEFVRLVLSSDLPQEEKEEVLAKGIGAVMHAGRN